MIPENGGRFFSGEPADFGLKIARATFLFLLLEFIGL